MYVCNYIYNMRYMYQLSVESFINYHPADLTNKQTIKQTNDQTNKQAINPNPVTHTHQSNRQTSKQSINQSITCTCLAAAVKLH